MPQPHKKIKQELATAIARALQLTLDPADAEVVHREGETFVLVKKTINGGLWYFEINVKLRY